MVHFSSLESPSHPMWWCPFIQRHHDPQANFDADTDANADSDADADANADDIADVTAHVKVHADVDACCWCW